jgi:luciferase-like monooxygenase
MRFGLFGGAVAPRSLDVATRAKGFHDFVDANVEAEALGFHSSFVTEHHFTGLGQVSAALTFLTFVAARTTRLRLGTAVLVLPWHNPVLLAEQAATLDLLSGGRLDLGVGKGYRHNEFAGFAMSPEEAEPRFEEALRSIGASSKVRATRSIRRESPSPATYGSRRTRRIGTKPSAANSSCIRGFSRSRAARKVGRARTSLPIRTCPVPAKPIR